MKRIILGVLCAVAAIALSTFSANAQATRTWVSGVGDDANPCSRTAPCKTFAGAISKTATGGEINCLDPAGYGAVTITKSITIDCEDTQGSILAAATNAIIVNGANAIVIIRGLSINGAGGSPTNAGLNGVRILQAAQVTITKAIIQNFRGGNGAAVDIEPSAGNVLDVYVHEAVLINNNFGIFAQPGAGINPTFYVDNVAMTRNTRGVRANGASIIGMFNDVVITDNVFGLDINAGAQLISAGNNSVALNGADTPAANGAFTSVRALQ